MQFYIMPDHQKIEDLYTFAKNSADSGHVSTGNVVGVITMLMSYVENMGSMPGSDKHDLVLHVLEKLVDESKIPDEAKEFLKQMLETTVPHIINHLVAAANGVIDFGTKSKCCGLF